MMSPSRKHGETSLSILTTPDNKTKGGVTPTATVTATGSVSTPVSATQATTPTLFPSPPSFWAKACAACSVQAQSQAQAPIPVPIDTTENVVSANANDTTRDIVKDQKEKEKEEEEHSREQQLKLKEEQQEKETDRILEEEQQTQSYQERPRIIPTPKARIIPTPKTTKTTTRSRPSISSVSSVSSSSKATPTHSSHSKSKLQQPQTRKLTKTNTNTTPVAVAVTATTSHATANTTTTANTTNTYTPHKMKTPQRRNYSRDRDRDITAKQKNQTTMTAESAAAAAAAAAALLDNDDDQSYASTQKAYSVSGVSVFDRLYHNAKVQSNRKQQRIQQAKQQQQRQEQDEEASAKSYDRYKYSSPRNRTGDAASTSAVSFTSSRRQRHLQQQRQSSKQRKQQQRRKMLAVDTTPDRHQQQQQKQHHDADADSVVSSLHSPSATASYYSEYHSPLHRQPLHYHHSQRHSRTRTNAHPSDLHSVTSEDRRRFFSSSSYSKYNNNDAFERLYKNQYQTSASRHQHKSPEHLSPAASLHRRVNYRPSPQQQKHAHFFRPAALSPSSPKPLDCASPLQTDDYFIESKARMRRFAQKEIQATLVIQRTWRRKYVQNTRLSVPELLANDDTRAHLKPRMTLPPAETNKKPSPNRTTPSAAVQLDKWKQLSRDWFLDEMDDIDDQDLVKKVTVDDGDDDHEDNDDNDAERMDGKNGHDRDEHPTNNAILLEENSSNAAEKESKVDVDSPLLRQQRQQSEPSQPLSSKNAVVDSTRELQWQELQKGWNSTSWSNATNSSLGTTTQPKRGVGNEPVAPRQAAPKPPPPPPPQDATQQPAACDSSPPSTDHANFSDYEKEVALTSQRPSPLPQGSNASAASVDFDAVQLLYAIEIQAQWRMVKAQTLYLGCRQACMIIQAAWRSHVIRQAFLEAIALVTAVQACWRRSVLFREYRYKRAACIMIQSHWRCYHAALIYQGHKRALARLQSWWRTLTALQEYERHCNSVLVIQAIVRGHCCQANYSLLRRNAMRVQSNWRRILACQQYRHQRAAAVLVQSLVRSKQTQHIYYATRAASHTIQRSWRASQEQKQESYTRQRTWAALMLQSFIRTRQCQRRYKQHVDAALRIQTLSRRHACQQRYQKQRAAAIELQSWTRSIACQRNLSLKRAAVHKIQSSWRSFVVRQKFKGSFDAANVICFWWREIILTRTQAATKLQTVVRRAAAQRQWAKIIVSCILIQSSLRCQRAQATYRQSRGATLLIQTVWRTSTGRRSFCIRRAAAIVIQAWIRGRLLTHRYGKSLSTIILMQSRLRGHMVRIKLVVEKKERAAIVIQSLWRRAQGVSALAAYRAAASLLQSSWKTHVHHKHFFIARAAGTIIAGQWRAAVARAKWTETRASVVTLQTLARMLAKKKTYQKMKRTAVFLQSRVRGRLTRQDLERQMEQKRQEQIDSIVVLQALARRRTEELIFQRKQLAALCIQTRVRILLANRELVERRKQALTDGQAQELEFQRQQLAALCIQTRVRILLANRELAERRNQALADLQAQELEFQRQQLAALCIQTRVRILLANRELAERRNQALADLQAQELEFQRHQLAALRIQTRVRILLANCELEKRKGQELEFQRQLFAVAKVQSFVRGRMCRSTFLMRKDAVVLLQAQIRAKNARRHYETGKVDAKMVAAATLFQSLVRMSAQRSKFVMQRAAAVCLESQFRRVAALRAFLARKIAVIRLQAQTRGWRSRKFAAEIRLQQRRTEGMIVVLQSFVRARADMLKLHRQKLAAIKLQSQTRGLIARRARRGIQLEQGSLEDSQEKQLVAETRAAITMQKQWRCRIARRHFQKMVAESTTQHAVQRARERPDPQHFTPLDVAAVCIQKTVRRFCRSKNYDKQKNAALRISRFYILWKTKLLLLKIQCGTVLLKRGVQSGMCTSFALSQVSSCLKSDFPLAMGQKGISSDVALRVGYIWGMASSQAKDCAAVVVQRYGRGLVHRKRFEREKSSIRSLQQCIRRYLRSCRYTGVEEVQISSNDPVCDRSVGVRFSEPIEVVPVKGVHHDAHTTEQQSTDGGAKGGHKVSEDNHPTPALSEVSYSAAESSSDDKEYEKGVSTLSEFFDNSAQEHQHRQDVTNWFLTRLEMKSETSAQLLLLDRSSNHDPRLRRLAERARSARAQIDRGESKEDGGFIVSRTRAYHGMETNNEMETAPILGIEGAVSPIAKKSIGRDFR